MFIFGGVKNFIMGSKDSISFKTKSQDILYSLYHPPIDAIVIVTKNGLECHSVSENKLVWEQDLNFSFTCATYHQDYLYLFTGDEKAKIRIFNILGNMLYEFEDIKKGHKYPITNLLSSGVDYLFSTDTR